MPGTGYRYSEDEMRRERGMKMTAADARDGERERQIVLQAKEAKETGGVTRGG